jgi:hypothetical protein
MNDEALAALRRRRHVEAIHRLGPRVVAELLDELARYHGIADDVDERLAKFATIDLQKLAAVGGHRFPPAPVFVVRRSA